MCAFVCIRACVCVCVCVACVQVMHRDTINFIQETTGAALITKGVYVPPGQRVRRTRIVDTHTHTRAHAHDMVHAG